MGEVRRIGGLHLPALVYCLVHRTTWGLLCRDCRRSVVVDPIALVEMAADIWTFDARAAFERAKCRECGGQMWNHRGYQIGGLQFNGWMPRLITSDGSDWQQPAAALLGPRLSAGKHRVLF